MFSGPSPNELKRSLQEHFPIVSALFWGFPNHLRNTCCRRRTRFHCAGNKHFWHWRRALLVLEMNLFCTVDKHVENVFELQPHTHSYTCSYQRLPNRTNAEMIATQRYSPQKTGSSYHALILTSEYATPTSYIYTQ